MSDDKNLLFFDLKEDKEDSDEDNFNVALKKKHFDGNKGNMLFELQQSYKGDQRFKLDNKFSNDIEHNKISYKVRELTDAFDKPLNKNEIKKHKTQLKGAVTIEEDLKKEKQRNISILSQVISNQDFLSIRSKTTNHQNLIIKRFDPLLNIGKEIENKQEEKINNQVRNKVVLKKGLDFEATVKNNYHENIEEFNLEKKLEINVDAWKSLNKKDNEVNNSRPTFLLFTDTASTKEKTQNPHPIQHNDSPKEENKQFKTSSFIITDQSPKNNEKEDNNFLNRKQAKKTLEVKQDESKRKQKKQKLEEKKKRLQEYKQKEKVIEEKIVEKFSKVYGDDKTKEYMRMVKLIKEKAFKKPKLK